MKIKWYGHACFGVENDQGSRTIIDPYEPGSFDGAVAYGPVEDPADVVLVSHDHPDHNYAKGIQGDPEVLTAAGEAAGCDFKTIETYHDESQGADRGTSLIFWWSVDGISVCHMGDIGHLPGNQQLADLPEIDVLMIPVGGHFTIDAAAAGKIVEMVAPKLVIPMHYKTDKCGFPISPVDPFLEGKENITRPGSSELSITKDALPAERQIVVLDPAL